MYALETLFCVEGYNGREVVIVWVGRGGGRNASSLEARGRAGQLWLVSLDQDECLLYQRFDFRFISLGLIPESVLGVSIPALLDLLDWALSLLDASPR